jgi:hypothetical protein
MRVSQPRKTSASALGYIRLQNNDSLMVSDSLMDFQGAKSQKEGQQDQGTLQQLGETTQLFYLSLVLLRLLLALSCLEIHQAIPRHQAIAFPWRLGQRPDCWDVWEGGRGQNLPTNH